MADDYDSIEVYQDKEGDVHLRKFVDDGHDVRIDLEPADALSLASDLALCADNAYGRVSLVPTLERSIILLAASRLEELLDKTEPGYYDYGSRNLVKALREMVGES